MKRIERIEMIAAILTAANIINTKRTEENFHEMINIYTMYVTELNRILPRD